MLPPVGIESGPLITSDSKSNTLLSGLSGTCQVSPERRVLDMGSIPGSIPRGGSIFHWIFLFSRSKDSDANIGITKTSNEKLSPGCARFAELCHLLQALMFWKKCVR